jgi:hypothetical protein
MDGGAPTPVVPLPAPVEPVRERAMTVKTWNRRAGIFFGSVTRKVGMASARFKARQILNRMGAGRPEQVSTPPLHFTGREPGDHAAEFCISASVMGNMTAIGRARPWGG